MRQDGAVRTVDEDDPTVYNRDFVLFGPLREEVLELEQVRKYGAEMFGDPDAISLYGMAPREWHVRGIRMLGRTTVECTSDSLARIRSPAPRTRCTGCSARFRRRPPSVSSSTRSSASTRGTTST
jgi:hypothetical protein